MKRLHPVSSSMVFIAILLGFLFMSIAVSIIGSYFVGIHESNIAAAKAIHAAEVAQQGRSRSLCDALKAMAETPDAAKLHPFFENLYADSGCVAITGRATP